MASATAFVSVYLTRCPFGDRFRSDMPDWPHSPPHKLIEPGAYMVTAGTYGKAKFFNTPERLSLIQNLLFELADDWKWQIQAWAIFGNHYHFIALSPDNPLKTLVNQLHSLSSRAINRLDGTKSRRIWFQYWDSHLTYLRSYFARLNYVPNNPVHHGLVSVASRYDWCSAFWFEQNATPAFFKTVCSFKTDKLKIEDNF